MTRCCAKNRRCFFLLLWAVCLSVPAAAQIYLFENYTEREGLNNNQIHSMVQDDNGLLWFATRGAVMSFDSQTWTEFGTESGIEEREFGQLAKAWDGTIWAVSKRAPFQVQFQVGEEWGQLPGHDLPYTATNACLFHVSRTERDSTQVVVGTEEGWLAVYRHGSWRHFNGGQRLESIRAFLPHEEKLVLACRQEVLTFDPVTMELGPNPFPFLPGQQLVAMAKSPDGGTIHFVGRDWVGTWDGSRFELQGRDLEIVRDQVYSRTNSLVSRAGGIFFGGLTRAYFFDPRNGLQTLDRRSGRLFGGGTCFFRDEEGAIWITGLRGVSKLNSLRFASYDRSLGLFKDEVSAVFQDSQGRMVLGHDGGLTIMDERISTVDFGLALTEVARVMDIAEDAAGNLWLATDSFGLGRLDPGGRLQWYRGEDGVSARCFSLVIDDQGVLWVGHNDGLSRGKDGVFHTIPLVSREGMVPQFVRRVVQASDGSLYLATGWDGVLRLVDGRVNQWVDPDGAVGNSTFAVLEMPDGRILVGTKLGLKVLQDDGTMVPSSFPDPVVSRPIYAMELDGRGQVWIGTDAGVKIWNGRELVSYSTEAGIIGTEVNRDGFQADEKGQMWVATDRGVSVYRPDHDLPRLADPRLDILGFDVDGAWLGSDQPLSLGSPPRTLTVKFRGISFTDERRQGYRTWLENYENGWSDLSSTPINQVRYTNLPAGDYFFHVQMVNGDGSASPVVVSRKIHIAPPLWSRWYVLALGLLAVTALAYVLVSAWEGRRYARRLEAEVRERTQELRLSERQMRSESQRLAATLGSILDGVLALDQAHRIVLCNPAAEAILDRTAQELVGRQVTGVLPVAEPATRELFDRKESWSDLIQIEKPGQETIHLEVIWSPILDDEEVRVGSVVAFSDITDRLRAERELIRSQKLESLGVLAGGIAHDFNNLLTIILGNVDLLERTADLQETDRESLGLARQASSRARTLTEQLLTFARGGAPQRKLQSLVDIIEQSVSLSLSGLDVACRVELAEDLGYVEVDAGQMSQVFNNLLINAAQAMPDGGRIVVRARNVDYRPAILEPGQWVCIEVRDQGGGIPEAHIGHIFDPYFTTKPDGSGLGLATSYSIVSRHGGKLMVDSVEGQGATFSVYLPRGQGEPVASVAPDKKAIPAGGKVLVLEDEEGIRLLLGEYLEELGLQVAFTVEGEETVALYEAALDAGQPFDLVITDLTIPGGMGGCKTLARLLELDPDVQAVVISGYSHEEVLARYQDFGFRAALTKPFQLGDLARVLGGVLGEGG
jgi:PAS domain S-box-containing protein